MIKKHRIKLSKINEILISHLHGDHYYGLMGLISTLHLFGRQGDLYIYGPPGLREIISLQLKYSQTRLSYDIVFKEWVPGSREIIFEDSKMTIQGLPLDHRIPCMGFLFKEKPKKRGLNKRLIDRSLTPIQATKLRNGEDLYDDDGVLIYENDRVTFPPKAPYSYAYCSDTRLIPDLHEHIAGVDMIYHESTFMDDMEERAASTYHTTAKQAAGVAVRSGTKKLLLGHFSTRYKNLDPLLQEAKSIFQESYLAEEGRKFVINH